MKTRNLITALLLTSFTLVLSIQKISAQTFWKKLSSGIPDPSVTRFTADTLGGIYALNKDSIYCSKDDGNTWEVMNYNLPSGHLIYLFTNKNGDLYASLKDGLYFLKEGNISWEKISENIEQTPVISLAVDSRNIIFATNFNWAYRSLDFGKSWKTTPYYNVSLIDINNDKVYIGGKSPGLLRTTDHGESWQSLFVGSTTIAALGFSSNGDVYAAMSPGASRSYILMIPDTGKGRRITWPMSDAEFYSLVGDRNGNVYMVLNPGSSIGYNPIFTLKDREETWTEISSGLPMAFGYAIGINTNGYLFTCINGFGIYRSSGSVNKKICVLSPKGGEQLKAGNSFEIKWSSESIDSIKIEFSADSGKQWQMIRSPLPASLEKLAWEVPAISSDKCTIRLTDNSDEYISAQSDSVFTITAPSAKAEEKSKAADLQYSLSQNYPNPFNPITTIKYSIAEAGLVNLRIYNSIGKEIITLVNQEKAAGSYEVMFDASGLPSGVYLYRIISGRYHEIKKLTVIK